MSLYGGWKEAVIASSGTASAAVDLGQDYDFLDIVLPTVDSGTISLQVSDVAGGTYQALGDSITTAATTGGYSTTFKLGGWQHIKVVSATSQTSGEVSIKVRGWRF